MKQNFTIDLELLSSLNISKSEAIILDMLDYISNNPHFPVFKVSNVSLAKLLDFSRGHLQRLIKGLIHKELIYKDSNRYIVSDYYKEVKNICFEKSHKKVSRNSKTKSHIIKDSKTKSHIIKNSKTKSLTMELKESLTLNELSNEIITNKNNNFNTNSQKNTEKLQKIQQNLKKLYKQDENLELLKTNNKADSNATKVNHNVTKVNHNVTLPIHYNIQNTISLFEKQRVDIAKNKINLEENVKIFLSMAKVACARDLNIDNFCLDSTFETQISEILSDYAEISTNIKLNKELTKNVDSKLLAEVKGYIAKFDYMYLPKAKQELINNLESMIKDGSLEVNFKICKEKRALSICYPSQIDECNKKAFGYLKELWNLISIRMNIAKKGLIARIKEIYKEKLIEYVEFREKKGRYFNEYSLNALCLTLAEYENKGINVESAISQSIERDYNWVFPPTHKPYKPRYYKYPKYSKNYKVA